MISLQGLEIPDQQHLPVKNQDCETKLGPKLCTFQKERKGTDFAPKPSGCSDEQEC